MMLADELIATDDLRPLKGGHDLLVKDLREAHRFELGQDFAGAVDTLKDSNPSAFVNALRACRLPYSKCWFEVTHGFRKSFVTEGEIHDDQRTDVQRVGMLIEAIDDTHLRWMSYLCWNFRNGQCFSSPVAYAIDFSEVPSPEVYSGRDLNWRDIKDRFKGKRTEIDAAVEIEKRCRPLASPYFEQLRREFMPHPEGREKLENWEANHWKDWAGETLFWASAVAMLNSRNVVATEDVHLEKLNRARRRRGVRPLLSYTTCKIAPRFRQNSLMTNRETPSDSTVRAHFVRGHFKIRKSGVFWWSPHLRGDHHAGFVAKDYRVEGERPMP